MVEWLKVQALSPNQTTAKGEWGEGKALFGFSLAQPNCFSYVLETIS
jgi:hypothetical protein